MYKFLQHCVLKAGRNNEMATSGDLSMISPPTSSSISNEQDPFGQLPPLLPPLRSTQVLQPITVFPVSNLNEDSYDYVFGGRRNAPTANPTLNLTSPPIRLRPEDICNTCSGIGGLQHNSTISTSGGGGVRLNRHSFSYVPRRSRHSSSDNERERNANYESRLRCHGEDEATLRQMLLDLYANK
ncbi:hypothetical protein GQX74_004000 [Glossina fuscipes]|nr:hypothetical protein GQX74_004000 [Glossina fuscipes]